MAARNGKQHIPNCGPAGPLPGRLKEKDAAGVFFA
ncbi:MAG: hypothetical protein KatS3mg024_1896 [Armatimonadota bacterium]|nr:MAG: hypothetical protein KatS3mg024_1896 [Armatimonadota bacterium]